MIVCSCNRITDRDVRAVVTDGLRPVTTPAKVYRAMGCQPKCGRCADSIRDIMAECAGACRAGHAGAEQEAA